MWRMFRQQGTALAVLQTVCLFHVVQEYAVGVAFLDGPSMKPTFRDGGDVVIVHRRPQKYRPGDVVVFRSPLCRYDEYCKRVAACAGEPVPGHAAHRVPVGHVWLAGDNPSDSLDSRHFGPVPLALLRGLVVARVWPPHLLGPVPSGPER